MKSRLIAITLSAGLLVGCATTSTGRTFLGPAKPESGTALMYLFRVSAFAGSLYVARFSIDGTRTGSLGNGEYFVRRLSPGRHVLKLEKTFGETGGEDELEVHAESGAVYYVQYAVTPGDVVHTGTGVLVLTDDELVGVPPESAVSGMRGLKEVE